MVSILLITIHERKKKGEIASGDIFHPLTTTWDAKTTDVKPRSAAHFSAAAGRVKLIEEFIRYAQTQKGVVFMRKDEIAKWALSLPT